MKWAQSDDIGFPFALAVISANSWLCSWAELSDRSVPNQILVFRPSMSSENVVMHNGHASLAVDVPHAILQVSMFVRSSESGGKYARLYGDITSHR
jgi:hypothetical protein